MVRPSTDPGYAHMYARFTDQARSVLRLAAGLARRTGGPETLPDHLWYGIVSQRRGLAVAALRGVGVDPAGVARELDTVGHTRPPTGDGNLLTRIRAWLPPPRPPLNPEAHAVVVEAVRTAKRLGHPCVGTEHLLLAVLADPDSPPAQLLTSRGVDLARFEAVVSDLLAGR